MLHIDSESGLIKEARQVPSPNYDARPQLCEPDLIVIHGISLPPGEFGGQWIDRLFTNTLDSSGMPENRAIRIEFNAMIFLLASNWRARILSLIQTSNTMFYARQS
jgi:N-acetyl-anhydromuramyl-L-alanine amidase AmpD